MNNKGMFAYNLSTECNFTATIRTADGTGSGWVSRDFTDITKLDTGSASHIAIRKSLGSRDARAMEPGRYTVILEPAASETLLANMVGAMSQRCADEGRSFLSRKAKDGEELSEDAPRNRVGEKLFDERVTIHSDPSNPDVPTPGFAADGHAVSPTVWIDKGVVKLLPNSRYWAEKTGVPYQPAAFTGGGMFGGNAQFIMEGGKRSLEDMIADTRRGVLVTRTWYIRQCRSSDPAVHRLDARRYVFYRGRRDQVSDQELPFQRIADRDAQQHRGTRQTRAHQRAHGAADENPRFHVLKSVGCRLITRNHAPA